MLPVILSPCDVEFFVFRYRLWILVWKNWTQFVRDRKQWRIVKESATSHSVLFTAVVCVITTVCTMPSPDERRLERRVWQAWREYQRRRKKKSVSCEVARQWHSANALRSEVCLRHH